MLSLKEKPETERKTNRLRIRLEIPEDVLLDFTMVELERLCKSAEQIGTQFVADNNHALHCDGFTLEIHAMK